MSKPTLKDLRLIIAGLETELEKVRDLLEKSEVNVHELTEYAEMLRADNVLCESKSRVLENEIRELRELLQKEYVRTSELSKELKEIKSKWYHRLFN